MKKIKINNFEYDFSKYGSLKIISPAVSDEQGCVFVNRFLAQVALIKNSNIVSTDNTFTNHFIYYDLINFKYYDHFKEKDEIYYYIKYLYQLCHQRIIELDLKYSDTLTAKDYNKNHKIKMNPQFLIINFETLYQNKEIQKMCQFMIDHSQLTNIYVIDIEKREDNYNVINTNSTIFLDNHIQGWSSFSNDQYSIDEIFHFKYKSKYEIKNKITQQNVKN